MIQLYFRDLRRRVERLERQYFRPTPKRVVLHFVDENDVPYLTIDPSAEQPEVRYPPLGPEDYAGDAGYYSPPPPEVNSGHPAAPLPKTSADPPTTQTQPTSAATPADPTQEPPAPSSTSSAPPARRPGFFLLAPVATDSGFAAGPPPATHYRPRNHRRSPGRCRHGPSRFPRRGGIHDACQPKASP